MPSAQEPKRRPVSKRGSGPSEIAPGVFVGGWKDAPDFVGARFCVLDNAPDDMPAATHIPIYDGSGDRADTGNLDRLVAEMRSARARGEPVLVFCGHGIRRAPLGGMWYLHRVEGLTVGSAYDRIRAVRPKVETAREWIGRAEELERA